MADEKVAAANQRSTVTDVNRIEVLDLMFLGRPGAIAAGLVAGKGGPAIVDPGPSSCLDGLRAALAAHGLKVSDIESILVTHVHLDHSGAAGTLVRENPRLTVFVHERGARHLIDPSRLVESASRIYGDQMERLWGEIAPVPGDNVRVLAGGERMTVGGTPFETMYTPGHASHHVCYFEPSSGVLFAGDTGGVHAGTAGYLMPPTPPPDIDVEAWSESIEKLVAWNPVTLFVTHFGPLDRAPEKLMELRERLHYCARIVRESFDRAVDDAGRVRYFVEEMRADFRRNMSAEDAVLYEDALALESCWHGLARYWRKKEPGSAKL